VSPADRRHLRRVADVVRPRAGALLDRQPREADPAPRARDPSDESFPRHQAVVAIGLRERRGVFWRLPSSSSSATGRTTASTTATSTAGATLAGVPLRATWVRGPIRVTRSLPHADGERCRRGPL